MKELTLTLTEKQAEVIATACEFFTRVKVGQFKEIIYNLLDIKLDTEEYCQRRDFAEYFLKEARKQIYPDLGSIGHSYGIGKFEDADRAFGIYELIRNALGDERKPYCDYDLPNVEVKEV